MFGQVCDRIAEETRAGDPRYNQPGQRYTIHTVLRAILRGDYDHLFN
jgi:hypothetical protein